MQIEMTTHSTWNPEYWLQLQSSISLKHPHLCTLTVTLWYLLACHTYKSKNKSSSNTSNNDSMMLPCLLHTSTTWWRNSSGQTQLEQTYNGTLCNLLATTPTTLNSDSSINSHMSGCHFKQATMSTAHLLTCSAPLAFSIWKLQNTSFNAPTFTCSNNVVTHFHLLPTSTYQYYTPVY